MTVETPNEQMNDEAFVTHIVQTIDRYQLSELALFALDLGRPVTFLGGQLLWMAQPLLAIFMSADSVSRLAQILEQPEAVHNLTDKLTDLTARNRQQ